MSRRKGVYQDGGRCVRKVRVYQDGVMCVRIEGDVWKRGRCAGKDGGMYIMKGG